MAEGAMSRSTRLLRVAISYLLDALKNGDNIRGVVHLMDVKDKSEWSLGAFIPLACENLQKVLLDEESSPNEKLEAKHLIAEALVLQVEISEMVREKIRGGDIQGSCDYATNTRLWHQERNETEAECNLENRLALLRKSTEFERRAEVLVAIGLCEQKEGNEPLALKAFQEAESLDPDSVAGIAATRYIQEIENSRPRPITKEMVKAYLEGEPRILETRAIASEMERSWYLEEKIQAHLKAMRRGDLASS